jgi:hypothetical protein
LSINPDSILKVNHIVNNKEFKEQNRDDSWQGASGGSALMANALQRLISSGAAQCCVKMIDSFGVYQQASPPTTTTTTTTTASTTDPKKMAGRVAHQLRIGDASSPIASSKEPVSTGVAAAIILVQMLSLGPYGPRSAIAFGADVSSFGELRLDPLLLWRSIPSVRELPFRRPC